VVALEDFIKCKNYLGVFKILVIYLNKGEGVNKLRCGGYFYWFISELMQIFAICTSEKSKIISQLCRNT